ncbi:unnamed protein product [Bursaphelenchus xylophilus]|uniref:(pine wood nematode) hypothetical protein n=1 Tax=Bursaphelenchus xylophilus TaxID=6326 RepID=A0A1I7RM27_BURXY|nr:unnamed protein product [Bursaphelenchus xylophilus]CAG9118146.1 unnamed protein product [Bursaphelenchus xylophilus]
MDWRTQLARIREDYFPTLTKSTFLRHYVPISGIVSHVAFTTHIFAPQLLGRVCPTYDLAVSNTVLFNTHVGIGFYVFFRKHMIRLNMWDRIEFSVFSSVIFNFGSLMFSVLLKSLLPKKLPTWANAIIGASVSTFLLSRFAKYVGHIDRRTLIPDSETLSLHNGGLHLKSISYDRINNNQSNGFMKSG